MTFKHKLSCRLALLRGAALLALGAAACSDQAPLTGTEGAIPVPPGTLAEVLAGTVLVGTRVEATHTAFLRTQPTVNSSLAGKQAKGARGTIIAGPVVDTKGDGLTRYQIDFDSGVDGWGAAPYFNVAPPAPVATITLTPSPVKVAEGESVALTAVAKDAQGRVLAGRTITFTATDTTIARVDAQGGVRGVKMGRTTVRATAEGKTATDSVEVTAPGIRVGARVRTTAEAYLRSAPSVSASLVGTQPVGATATVLEGPVTDAAGDGLVRWRLDFDSGYDGWGAEPYIALLSGDSTVTPPVSGSPTVDVTPATASLLVGATVQLTAVAKDAAGATVPASSLSWSSRNATVASVNSNGLVTALLAGTAWVVVTNGTAKDSTAVTVTANVTTPTVRVGKYVAPNGASGNDGSYGKPWDLATALAGASGRVAAGDTIWVRGGTYRGPFTSTVAGTSGKPVVIRAYPGERATIEHSGTTLTTLHVRGAWSVFWGLEVMNPNTTRVTSSTASEQRANGVVNNASNTKYINMIIRDAGVGFYNYTNLANVEVNGSIFYNNGWQGPDRGHGHGMYIKSDNGPILLKDNVLFNQFGYGVHVYTNAGSGKLNNIRIEGNTAFNNGTLSTNSNSENILLGGADYSTGSAVVNNLTYFSSGKGGRNVRVGYGTLMNGSVQVTGNRFVGGNPVFEFGYWTSATVSGNRFVGGSQMVRKNNNASTGLTWLTNSQFRDPASTSWYAGGSWRTFSAWKTATGIGLTDIAASGTPVGPEITVRPSTYEPGRAVITVFDWSRLGSVTVPLAGVLAIGDRFEVRNVQAPFGPALVSGTFGGSVTLPMGAVSAPAPVGMSSSVAPRLGADFDVFIITRLP